MVKNVRHYSFQIALVDVTDHGVRLATSSLSIGENRAIIALEGVFYDREGS